MADVNEEQVQTLSETILPVTAHHFIVQHMMATAAAAAAAAAAASTSRQIQLEEEKLTSKNSSHDFGENSSSLSRSSTSKSNSPTLAPLNLTKNNCQSESDSDASLYDDRNTSSRSANTVQNDHSSQDSPTDDEQTLHFALSKLISLIEEASAKFKTEREMIESEKSFVAKLCDELELKRSEHDKIRHELSREQRKAKIYFRRYCKAKQESLDLRAKLASAQQSQS